MKVRENKYKHSIEKICKMIEDFISKNGHCNIPLGYCTEDNIHLGWILDKIDNGMRPISDEDKQILKSYNYRVIKKKIRSRLSFDDYYPYIVDFKNKYNHCNINPNYITEDGVKLGLYAYSLRSRRRRIPNYQKKMLEELGFKFSLINKHYTFEELFDLIVKYKQEFGHCAILSNYKTEDGIRLGAKVYAIRTGKRKLSNYERERLKSIGFF